MIGDGGGGGDGEQLPRPSGDSAAYFLPVLPQRHFTFKGSPPAVFWLGDLRPWPQKSPPPVPNAWQWPSCLPHTHLLFKALHRIVKTPSVGPPSAPPPQLSHLAALATPVPSPHCPPIPSPHLAGRNLHCNSLFGRGVQGLRLEFVSLAEFPSWLLERGSD